MSLSRVGCGFPSMEKLIFVRITKSAQKAESGNSTLILDSSPRLVNDNNSENTVSDTPTPPIKVGKVRIDRQISMRVVESRRWFLSSIFSRMVIGMRINMARSTNIQGM